MTAVRRHGFILVDLGPSAGAEMRKMRPCILLSPDEINRHLKTIIVAPMTAGGKTYASRVPTRFSRRDGHVALDQIMTIDRTRIVKRLGAADRAAAEALAQRLIEMFTL